MKMIHGQLFPALRSSGGLRGRFIGRCAWVLTVAAAPVVPAGCATTDGRTAAEPAEPAGTEVAAGVTGPAEASLDERYLVGPTIARELGRRIDFQTFVHPEHDSGIAMVVAEDDSIFILDGGNFLTRLRLEDGQRIWRLPITDPYREIYGITYFRQLGHVLVTVGGDVLVLDRNTGAQVDLQKLVQMASTAPIPFGGFLIYGSRSGQIVWHSYEVGHQWRAYEIASTVRLAPLMVDGIIIAIGADGRVMAMDPRTATGIWNVRLLNEVIAPPAAGHGLVFLAGLDQYVTALDLDTGRRVWRYLTEGPLVDPPVLSGKRLFQQIPTEGLVCFEAHPVDAPGGVRIWTAPGVPGTVVSEYRQRLLVWDNDTKQLSVLDADRGAVVSTFELPGVTHLFAPDVQSGELYAAGEDGRVTRLVPR